MFRSYAKELSELREHLLSEHGMRPRYTSAFLNAYGRRMAKRYRKAVKISDSVMGSPQSGVEQTLLAFELTDMNLVFVAAAYKGYMTDLRRGRHVGTDVERAIWAILHNCSSLLSDLDEGLADYIEEHAEEKFPTLYGEVIQLDDGQL